MNSNSITLCTYFKQEPYRLGARNLVVFDIAAVGCIPAVVVATNTTGQCSKLINQLVVTPYNQELQQKLPKLRSRLKGSQLVRGATFNFSLNINLNPAKFGEFRPLITLNCCNLFFHMMSVYCQSQG